MLFILTRWIESNKEKYQSVLDEVVMVNYNSDGDSWGNVVHIIYITPRVLHVFCPTSQWASEYQFVLTSQPSYGQRTSQIQK